MVGSYPERIKNKIHYTENSHHNEKPDDTPEHMLFARLVCFLVVYPPKKLEKPPQKKKKGRDEEKGDYRVDDKLVYLIY